MFKTSFITTIALALTLGTAGGASASQSPEPASRTVKFQDLNLSSPSGAQTLLRRIKGAARYVCSVGNESSHWNDRKCVRQATDRAVEQLGNPMVSALHSQGRVQIAQK